MSNKITTTTVTTYCENSNTNSNNLGVGGGPVTSITTSGIANNSVTPVRRLRTRTLTSGSVSDSSSTQKKNGPLTERNNSINDTGFNVLNSNNAERPITASKKYHNSCPHTLHPSRKGRLHSQAHSTNSFDMNKTEEFHFDTPKECPVFRPTNEEFKNPLAYISKIRPIAEKCGIAKILPPSTWSPPFAVDVDKLKFTPRIQRLNELEAKTRVKLNFLDQIAKFWELQGSSLKIPMVERKALDLYSLHRIVQEEGGVEQTTKERKWAKVANRMSYPSSKSVGATLKAHYERILHPFEVYTSGKVLGANTNSTSSVATSSSITTTTATTSSVEAKLEDGTDYKVHEIPTRQKIAPPNENNARRSKRFANSTVGCGLGANANNNNNNNKSVKTETKEDFKRDLMHSFNASTNVASTNNHNRNISTSTLNSSTKKVTDATLNDPLMKYICNICDRGDVEESMLLCDGCDDSYHTFCLLPPLSSIPKGEWLCPRCVVEEVSKPTEAFGFEQAEREYTLHAFGQMADKFKEDYFQMPVHMVPTSLVEREFWRIVSSIDEDVTVEYGADLHTMDHGSGFPTKSSLYLLSGDQEYAESSWNLNNLPLLEDSILGHINADISGMNAPWMYVGMCFAAFCWHIEDHWSYSINYLHWGEPKTWYGVPGSRAEQFEETMKKAAPELFTSQPDLLHQLVTIMNPNILMNNGVPVYRTDQNAGEFVITFPRAYHAGFNQGYNFAEAVNFAPADWLKMGRECVNHYSMLRRFCVFSHDELVCKMALEPAKLTFGIATACYIDMAEMVDSEKKLRKSLLEWGVTRAERKPFELVPDDERHCQECNTTCFLSAVSCECTKALVCLRHYTVLCRCSPEKHTLLYRYTLDEMPLMLQKLKTKAQNFERWLSRCRDIVDASTPTSVTLQELQELCKEAEIKKFPSSLLIDRLNAAVLEAEKCVTVIQQLGINKVRTRSDNNLEAAQYKLTMEELELFVQEIDNLCCIIEEGASVRELFILGKQFVERANNILKLSLNNIEESDLESLINEGSSLRIELNQMQQLHMRLKQLKWYKRSQGIRNSSTKLTYDDIKNLLHVAAADIAPNDPIIDKEIRKLQEIGASIETWECQAAKYFNSVIHRNELVEIEQLLQTATEIGVPSYAVLKDALRKAKEWLRSVEQLQSNDHFPYCHTLESIVMRGESIPIKLEELVRMQDHLKSAYEWKENTELAFLKKQTFYTLLEVLMPRSEPVTIDSDLKKPFDDEFVKEMNPAQIVESFKLAEEKELQEMRALRLQNLSKSPARSDYCFCKSPFNGLMYNCQLCLDWFHDGCVPLPSISSPLLTLMHTNQNDPIIIDIKMKWLCPSCVRSKRPRLETILPLLVSLQTLPIRLPEDEALRCLAERAMNWQDRARKALTSPDVTTTLEAINLMQQRYNKRNHRLIKNSITSTNTTISGVATSVNNTGSTKKYRRCSQRNSKDGTVDNVDSDDDEGRLHIVEDNFSNDDDDGQCPPTVEIENSKSLEHIYKLLSENDTNNLNELMMEGDLLEVSLDESQDLWKILAVIRLSNKTEAEILVEQHQLLQKQQQNHTSYQSMSAANSAAEDSNDSLCVQSSPNSNSGGSISGRTSATNNTKKRRTLDANSGCTLPRKKTATPNKQQSSSPGAATTTTVIMGTTSNNKKSSRKSEANNNSNNKQALDENIDNQNSPKLTNNGFLQGNNNTLIGQNQQQHQQQKKQRKRLSNNVSSNTGGSVGGGNQKKNSQRAQLTQQDDDEEECRAENCHKPTGREVDWVQCDGGCNEWFHMYCVGLNRSQIKADDDYICVRCSKAVNATTAIGTAVATSNGVGSSNQQPISSVATSSLPPSASPPSLSSLNQNNKQSARTQPIR